MEGGGKPPLFLFKRRNIMQKEELKKIIEILEEFSRLTRPQQLKAIVNLKKELKKCE